MLKIKTFQEYDYVVKRGGNPLRDWRRFYIDIDLRIRIQTALFGTDFQKANQKFYEYMWKHEPHVCEETAQPLGNYSAVYISHIISKGSNRAMALDPRNVNILTYDAHQMWEFGTVEQKMGMNIWPVNQIIINLLKKDYER